MGRGRSLALTLFALAIGAVGALPLWWARLPDGRTLVRIVTLPVPVFMALTLAGLAVAQARGHSIVPPRAPAAGPARRRRVTRTRLLLAWYVLVTVLLPTDVPMRLTLLASRPALEAQVRAVRSGGSAAVPRWIGGFPVSRVTRDHPGPGWISFQLPGNSQLVHGEAPAPAGDPYLHHIDGHWYWYRWEGAGRRGPAADATTG